LRGWQNFSGILSRRRPAEKTITLAGIRPSPNARHLSFYLFAFLHLGDGGSVGGIPPAVLPAPQPALPHQFTLIKKANAEALRFPQGFCGSKFSLNLLQIPLFVLEYKK
jgi:hypothetical protein